MPDNQTTYVQGTQAMSLPVFPLDGGQALGTIRLVNLGAAMRCLQDVAYGSPVPNTGEEVPGRGERRAGPLSWQGCGFWQGGARSLEPAL